MAETVITLRVIRKKPRAYELLEQVGDRLGRKVLEPDDLGVVAIKMNGRGPRAWEEVRAALDDTGDDWRQWLHLVAAPAALTGMEFERPPRRDPVRRVPETVEPGLHLVDGTWGDIRPISLAPGVRTVGELEVIEHIRSGGRVIDTRREEVVDGGMIATAEPIRPDDVVEALGELAPAAPVVLYCNGPQCAATPEAIEALLAAGRPAAALLYYRGGIHDWVTLGLPLVEP